MLFKRFFFFPKSSASYPSNHNLGLILQFSKREPEDTKSADSDRDIFNEKPSKEEVMAATQAEGPKRVSDSAIIHTSMGDIHIKLFPVE